MSLVFSAIVPHPPILIPTIGKDNLARLKATQAAYDHLGEDLALSGADTVIIISPHGPQYEDAFVINLSPQFIYDFQPFGDLSTKGIAIGNIGLAHRIKESMETKVKLQLISDEKLDHGISIPISILTQKLPKIKIIPLYYSGQNLSDHYEFGRLLNHEIIYHPEQIAIIASGDLSHRLTKNAPGGYSPKGKKFDKKLMDYLLNKRVNEITGMSNDEIRDAGECGLRSIVILLGILEGIKYEPEIYSYEAPFGVGYLVMNFKL
jgi:AmmeMemoRadiSam system protein B